MIESIYNYKKMSSVLATGGQPLEIPGTSEALPKIKELLDFYRENNKHIVHIIRIYKVSSCKVGVIPKNRLRI